MAITGQEFLDGLRQARDLRVEQGRGPGPMYRGNEKAPLIWGDQFFARGLTPTGALDIMNFEPLRVGATQSSIDLVIIASHSNTGTLLCPAGSSITVALYQCDTEDGLFEQSGYEVTYTNVNERNLDPDCQVCRVYIGSMEKAFCVPKITFTGVFAGGTVDVGLARSVR
ncbi:MAG: hypothetical protein IJU79_02335 [Desulfovibrionaceae bacterium]|nr:hypothetical protein [Desulfovibrionaceae bacterium]